MKLTTALRHLGHGTLLRSHRAQQAEEKLRLGPAYADHGLVFCRGDGTPIDQSAFNQALKHAGLPAIRLHDARHTYATWLLEQGEHPKVVQTLLGHSRIAVTLDLYSYVSLDLEKLAVARLNAALMGGSQ